MKKFLFSVLAVGALVACTKSEVKYEGESEIAFRPVASVATKANVMHAIDGTEYPVNETFRVFAYWQNLPSESDPSEFINASTYIAGKTFEKDGEFWKGASKSYYWPKTGSLVFACFSPAAPGFEVNHTLSNDNFNFRYEGPINDEGVFDTNKTIDFMWSNATKSYDEAKGQGGVKVVFNHTQSWITFKVKGDEVTSSDMPNKGFIINSLTIDQIKYIGNFNSSTETKWGLADKLIDVPVFVGNKNLTTEDEIIENVDAGTLVLPQNNTNGYEATITFTNNLGDTPITEVVKVPLGKEWEIGKHYTYYITFTAKEILIAPEVTDWKEVDPADQFIF